MSNPAVSRIPTLFEEIDKIGRDAYNSGKADMKYEILKILQKYTIEREGPHGTGSEIIDSDCINEIINL